MITAPRTGEIPAQRATPPQLVDRQRPPFLRHTQTERTDTGHWRPAGTVGQHAAGLLDTSPAIPATRPETATLADELTAAMQTAAAGAQLERYSDLIPYLAKVLVCHGWVQRTPT